MELEQYLPVDRAMTVASGYLLPSICILPGHAAHQGSGRMYLLLTLLQWAARYLPLPGTLFD